MLFSHSKASRWVSAGCTLRMLANSWLLPFRAAELFLRSAEEHARRAAGHATGLSANFSDPAQFSQSRPPEFWYGCALRSAVLGPGRAGCRAWRACAPVRGRPSYHKCALMCQIHARRLSRMKAMPTSPRSSIKPRLSPLLRPTFPVPAPPSTRWAALHTGSARAATLILALPTARASRSSAAQAQAVQAVQLAGTRARRPRQHPAPIQAMVHPMGSQRGRRAALLRGSLTQTHTRRMRVAARSGARRQCSSSGADGETGGCWGDAEDERKGKGWPCSPSVEVWCRHGLSARLATVRCERAGAHSWRAVKLTVKMWLCACGSASFPPGGGGGGGGGGVGGGPLTCTVLTSACMFTMGPGKHRDAFAVFGNPVPP